MGEKVGFTNCVFEKLCFPENTIFIVFSAKHSFSKTKTVCGKKQKIMKNSGLFLNMANGVFWVWFFWSFNIKKVCFGVSGIVSKVLKMLVFPSFLGFSGVAYYCSSGFGRFRCFCVSCVCFSMLCSFCFCFVCFVIGFAFLFCFLFCFFSFFFVFLFVLFFCFVSFGGFKGQVRWPKGPPHLALNPPYFFGFCFLFVFFLFLFLFCFCFFLEGLRVRWGGPKGHLTWP